MKKQNTAVRRAALAVLYLAVFAAAVMYLRVTISVPAEGDDKLTCLLYTSPSPRD